LKARRFTGPALAALLLTTGLSTAPALAAAAPSATCGGSGTVTTQTGTLADGATYEMVCPAKSWNGTLFLYSHGYVVPGGSNPAEVAGDHITKHWLLQHGFALAGSSYATTGWAIQQAIPDQIATLNAFTQTYRKPKRTIAWGHSLGGMVTEGLVQRYPHSFAGAVPMCGVGAGGIGTWNTALDAAFAFQQLIDPTIQVVHITNPTANMDAAIGAAAAAQQTAQGKADLALVAALGDIPGWYTPLSKEPKATNYAAQERNQFLWDKNVDFPFVFAFRAELEFRALGNPSWTTGVNYAYQLAHSADHAEVVALFKKAHLNLKATVAKLQNATPISADPTAVTYLTDNITFNGNLQIPVLTVHTTGDGLVVPEQENAYRQTVRAAGKGALLRQLFVHRAGHCAFTPAEMITAIRVMLNRLSTGRWNRSALTPAVLNRKAAALGPNYNIFVVNNELHHAAPQFVSYHPLQFPTPFNLAPAKRR
jgi:pimeloyl-ACP methyl ester carboxylesterase